MTEKNLGKWAMDKDVIVGLDPDNSDGIMAIVQDWETVKSNNWEPFCESVGLNSDNYGFSDSYTTCSDCGKIIRTSPDSYGWSPDFWLNSEDGQIVCSECLADCEDEYLEWLADQSKPVGCILDEEALLEHGFTRLLQGLHNGMHEGDTDNPTAILEYLRPSYEVAFVLSPSQFTTGFDVWVRWGPTKKDSDYVPCSGDTISELRASMVKSTFESRWGNSDTLRTEYANLYTAKAMQQALKASIAELRVSA